MPATAITIQDFWPKNDMPTPDINKKCPKDLFLDIYYRTFTIAISPRGNDFKGVISKVPGGNSYFEASMIDMKNSSCASLTIALMEKSSRITKVYALGTTHVVFWSSLLYSL